MVQHRRPSRPSPRREKVSESAPVAEPMDRSTMPTAEPVAAVEGIRKTIPFTADGRIDWANMREKTATRLRAALVAEGLTPAGSNGLPPELAALGARGICALSSIVAGVGIFALKRATGRDYTETVAPLLLTEPEARRIVPPLLAWMGDTVKEKLAKYEKPAAVAAELVSIYQDRQATRTEDL